MLSNVVDSASFKDSGKTVATAATPALVSPLAGPEYSRSRSESVIR